MSKLQRQQRFDFSTASTNLWHTDVGGGSRNMWVSGVGGKIDRACTANSFNDKLRYALNFKTMTFTEVEALSTLICLVYTYNVNNNHW